MIHLVRTSRHLAPAVAVTLAATLLSILLSGAPASAGGPEAPPSAADRALQPAATEALPVRASVGAARDVAPDVRMRGSGWGHGVGMSQYGAYAQARAGRSADQILGHYYPGTEIVTRPGTAEARIRVSILDGVASTTVEAASGPVEWQRCRPDPSKDETVGSRVTDCHTDAAGSKTWFTQPQGTTLVVCPFREPATDPDTGAAIPEAERRDGLRLLTPAEHQSKGCADGQAQHWTLAYPVARVQHDGTIIRTPSHSGVRPYRDGWRDLHSRQKGTTLSSVQDIPSVERYLRGLAEVPSSWGRTGAAALEAQAITGRTFAVGRLGIASGCACDLRATPADQNYTGYSKETETDGALWVAAVDATRNRVLTYQGGLAQTFYSSSHGGRTENIEDSWAYGTNPVPYLRSIDDPWSLQGGNPRAAWQAFATNRTMATFLSVGQSPAITRVERTRVRSRTEGGTPRELEVTGSTADGQRVTFTTDLDGHYAKGIAGAAMRRGLGLAAGGSGGRLYSSQLRDFSFAPFDDDDGSVHEYAITWAARAGVVSGLSATRFAPNRSVTRAQMATFLVNTFEVPVPTESRTFSDVAPGDTHAANIHALVAAGIVRGYDDDTFRPDESVTRAQMATFLAGAMALSSDARGTFTDVSGAGTHDAAIEAIAAAGITSGCATARFCPSEPVQRGQLASFVEQAVAR